MSSVIISRRPCALLKYVKHNAPLAVNKDKCIGCKSCMKIGCPAISIKEARPGWTTPCAWLRCVRAAVPRRGL